MSTSISPIPIRGKIDTSQPVMLTAFDKIDRVCYILCEVNYLDPILNTTISEAVFIPSFTGGMTFPYTSQQINGVQWFGQYAIKDPITSGKYNVGSISGLPNFSQGASQVWTQPKIVINYIQPLPVVYSIATGGFNLIKYSFGTENPKYLSGDVSPSGSLGYTFRTIFTEDKNKSLVFTMGGASAFFLNGNTAYSGMNYTLSATGMPEGVSTPFRNLVSFNKDNGNVDGYRMSSYNNQTQNPNQFYRQTPADPSKNVLYLLYASANPSDATEILPAFNGQSYDPPTIGNTNNIPLTNLEYFLLPMSYYISNFSLSSENAVSGSSCSQMASGANPYPTNILNYLYYAWASGYPQSLNAGPIIDPPTGFVLKGSGPLNLAGWMSVTECNKSYFYNYCGAGTFCNDNNCYGPCANTAKPFCDANPYFIKATEKSGLAVWECEPSATFPQSISLWWILGAFGAVIVFFAILLVIIIVLIKKKPTTSRNNAVEVSENL